MWCLIVVFVVVFTLVWLATRWLARITPTLEDSMKADREGKRQR